MRPESKRSIIEFLTKEKIRFQDERWTNFMGSLEQQAIVVEVDNEKQVSRLLQHIHEINQLKDERVYVRPVAGWADPEPNCFSFFDIFNKHNTEKYNESFSFSPGGLGDIIIRFSPKFQKQSMKIEAQDHQVHPLETDPIKKLKKYTVNVHAGMQIQDLADYLEKHNKSLTTVSMISTVSVVGLAMNAGHGTGRNEPSFAGLIRELRICDHEGKIRTVKVDDEDFEIIRSALAGVFGVVLSMKIECVEAFKLKETVVNYPSIEALKPKLNTLMQNNEYFTFMHMPSYLDQSLDHAALNNWQVRLWNYTDQEETIDKPLYTPGAEQLSQEISTGLGASLQDHLLDKNLSHLMPAFMTMASSAVETLRGTDPIIGKENYITHYQTAFPRELRDLSFLIPVDDASCGDELGKHLEKIDSLLQQAKSRGETPITYAVYARYFSGTNGGLSTSRTDKPNQKILALEVVTHPNAPGFKQFAQELFQYFDDNRIKPRYHLGKDMPESVMHYEQFLGKVALNAFNTALFNWYGGNEPLQKSPFITPYYQKMLGFNPLFKLENKPHSIKKTPEPRQKAQLLENMLHAVHDRFESTLKDNPELQQCYELFEKQVQSELSQLDKKTKPSHEKKIVFN